MKGMRIDSYPLENGGLYLEYMPQPHHVAFSGFMHGGVIGSLVDCHCNWTAALAIMKFNGWDRPKCTVTATFSVKFFAPTPLELLKLTSEVIEVDKNKAKTKVKIEAGGKICAEGMGFFV